jgi:hypothetical protein
MSSAPSQQKKKFELSSYYCYYTPGYTYNSYYKTYTTYYYQYCYYSYDYYYYNNPLSGGAIAGIVIGCVSIFFACISCCIKASRRRAVVVRRNAYNPIAQQAYNPNSVPNSAQRLVVNGASSQPAPVVTRDTYTAQPVNPNNYGYAPPAESGNAQASNAYSGYAMPVYYNFDPSGGAQPQVANAYYQ